MTAKDDRWFGPGAGILISCAVGSIIWLAILWKFELIKPLFNFLKGGG